MKLSVVVASENALPSAFSVFRGVREGIEQAARLGYDGVELAVRDGREFSPETIKGLLREKGLAVSALSTGQLFAHRGLWLSARDKDVRSGAVGELIAIIDMAGELGCVVNIGRARGFVEDGEQEAETTARFMDSMSTVGAHAGKRGVRLVLEPVNRYETNYINSVEQGAALIEILQNAGISGVGLMPDFFHMNIEDGNMEETLRRYSGIIDYIHAADSNRLAPGWGHTPFASLIAVLDETGYKGWITAEVLPQPSPEAAAKQAVEYLRKFYPKE